MKNLNNRGYQLEVSEFFIKTLKVTNEGKKREKVPVTKIRNEKEVAEDA